MTIDELAAEIEAMKQRLRDDLEYPKAIAGMRVEGEKHALLTIWPEGWGGEMISTSTSSGEWSTVIEAAWKLIDDLPTPEQRKRAEAEDMIRKARELCPGILEAAE